MAMSDWYVYIIDKKGKLYVGITTDIENRMRQHAQAVPLYKEGPMGKAAALRRERQLKGWRKEKKLALIEHA